MLCLESNDWQLKTQGQLLK